MLKRSKAKEVSNLDKVTANVELNVAEVIAELSEGRKPLPKRHTWHDQQ
jgi:hypothetical protein